MREYIQLNNPDDHSLDGVNAFTRYDWFKLDSMDIYNSKHYSRMEEEHDAFLLKERVPLYRLDNNDPTEYYVDIYYKDANGDEKVISSCPIQFGIAEVNKYQNDGTISTHNVGNIIVKRTANNQMLVMSAKDGEASWLNTQGNTISTYDISAGGSLIPLPESNGLYILRVEAGKNTKKMKVLVQ